MDGFKVIGCVFSEESSVQHQIFVKEHAVRNQTEDKPSGKTLFIVNTPPYATEESLKNVFTKIGPVQNVFLQKDIKQSQEQQTKILGYKVAYVVFKKSSDLQKVLKLKVLGPFSTTENPITLSVAKWIREYNESIISRKELKQYCTDIIKGYDITEKKSKKGQQVTDDEGWTIVTNKGRHSGLARTETTHNKLADKQMKGLTDFYRFQKRENKMKEISTLRKKHEEDKKKIEIIKKARKFKPY